jgi:hypothetical protein
MPMVVQLLPELPTPAILLFFAHTAKSLWSIFGSFINLRNVCAAVGISPPSQRDMPMD